MHELGPRPRQDAAHATLRRSLLALGDTIHSEQVDRYVAVLMDLGFEPVLAEPFVSRGGLPELLQVHARRDGLLLVFDTYATTGVDDARVYFNWRPGEEQPDRWPAGLDGYAVTDEDGRRVYVGEKEACADLRQGLGALERGGGFVAPWLARPFLRLLHQGERRAQGQDHAAITEARVARLPGWVQAMIGAG